MQTTLVGRSSSHFTRVTRVFASELHVGYSLQVVPDLMSSDVVDYGGNPALRLPTLRSQAGAWFGALNICRELSRQSSTELHVVWPEDLVQPVAANAQELVVQAMASEVALIMGGLSAPSQGSAHQAKLRQSLLNSLAWLESNASEALASLPAGRDLSYLEVTLFCLITHLEFRQVLPLAAYPELTDFCQSFGKRASAVETQYRFDT